MSRLVVRWAPTKVSKLPLESADGDDAESVRWRLRERVAGPDGDDGGVAPAGQPPGGGGLRRRPPFVLLHGSAFWDVVKKKNQGKGRGRQHRSPMPPTPDQTRGTKSTRHGSL